MPRVIFVGAHLGPFQLQMDLLADLPQAILILYRSYRWPVLAREVAKLRLETDRFRYADIRNPREIVDGLKTGRSIALLGDARGKNSRRPAPLRIFGRVPLEDSPVRMAIRLNAPIYVGGLYNVPTHPGDWSPQSVGTFGVDYSRVDPGDYGSTARSYAAAMEHTIRNNPSDWVHLS